MLLSLDLHLVAVTNALCTNLMGESLRMWNWASCANDCKLHCPSLQSGRDYYGLALPSVVEGSKLKPS